MSRLDPSCGRRGAKLAPDAKFCRECGDAAKPTADGVVACPSCSAPTAPGASFCRSCGERLPGAAQATVPTEPAADAAGVSRPRPAGRPLVTPPQTPPPSSDAGRGGRPLLAVLGVIACLAVGGGVAAAAYLLLSDQSDGGGTIGAVDSDLLDAASSAAEDDEPRADDSELGSGPTDEFLSPTERGFPTDSESAMRVEAEELLREFHVALVERDFQYAWSLLSSRKRRKEEQEKAYAGWKEAQSTLTPYLLPDGIDVEIAELEDEGVARVQVTGMGWTQPGSACSEWSGLTWVRYEGGAWRYDPGYSTTAERRRDWENRSSELLGVGC